MSSIVGLPGFLPRWLGYVAVWVALTVVFASQLYWSGYAQWPTALWLEAIHWLSWGIVAPLVFWLCRRLYRGEHTWPRYVVGLTLGAVVVSILQPALIESINFAKDSVQLWLSITDRPPRSILSELHITVVKIAGYNLPFYVVLVLAWHALTYYEELRDRQVKAMQLESLKRGKGFGEMYGEKRSGEWEYAGYKLDGTYKTTPEACAHCAECHRKAGPENDFVYRMRPLAPTGQM